ncbi:MAG: dTDP-4-dehydrorhamnose 3,5-epimerase [Spirochaetia bacterium]|nr:dTDP-4-dehydrorhamnose 3,5-epimerase [Spirochaetia bacterium]
METRFSFKPTGFSGLTLCVPKVHVDERGRSFESYRSQDFETQFGKLDWFLEYISESRRGVIRGLHYQVPPFAQPKWITVLRGSIFDVVVDLRKSSSTFGKVFTTELSMENAASLFIPAGFAHAFQVTTESALTFYKLGAAHAPECERGIFAGDPSLAIAWPMPEKEWILSAKDRSHPVFSKAETFS